MKHTQGKWDSVDVIGPNLLFLDKVENGKRFESKPILKRVSLNKAFAAPELLEALKEAKKWIDDDYRLAADSPTIKKQLLPLKEKINSAIKKAEGK